MAIFNKYEILPSSLSRTPSKIWKELYWCMERGKAGGDRKNRATVERKAYLSPTCGAQRFKTPTLLARLSGWLCHNFINYVPA